MKKAIAVACALTLGASVLYAGGSVAIEDEQAVAVEKPASSAGALIPMLLLAVIGLAIASGGDDAPQGCVLPN